MTIPTSAELVLLRTRPQQTRLWLSIYKPETVFQARVNEPSIVMGERQVQYSGASSGTYANIENGMTMLVGTTLGGNEKGKIRVRSATPSVLTVAENSHINWADGDYLTVLNFFEITAMYPRIVLVSGTMNTLWYKDYDIDYTNQNDVLGTNICMGSHFAGFLENGNCPVYYSSTGTHNFLGEPLEYLWEFEGGTPATSTDADPGYVIYDTPGHYTTKLTVSNVGTPKFIEDISYRHISIYDRPENGLNTPILHWEMEDLQGSRDTGGYTTRIKIYENIVNIADNALVVIFSENWYGNTKQSIGGNAQNRQSIVFCGYITKGSIQYNYKDSFVEFDVGSPTEIMKQVEGFSVAVQSSPDPSSDTDPNIPSKWVLIKDLDVERGIYHYLKWHSTALLCNDFEFRGTNQLIQYFDSDRTSLYDAIQTFLNGTILGALVSDKQGKLWAETDISAISSAITNTPITLNMTYRDWMEEPVIDERKIPAISSIEMGGMECILATGSYGSIPYLSSAPGSVPGYGGENEQIEGLAVASQASLDELVGNVYAYKNSKYPSIPLNLSQNFGNLDIAPQEAIEMNIVASDTVRGITMVNKPFAIREVSWKYAAEQQIFLSSVELSEITEGYDGTPIIIPPPPPPDPTPPTPLPPPPLPPYYITPYVSSLIVLMPTLTYYDTALNAYLTMPYPGIISNTSYEISADTIAPKTCFGAKIWITFTYSGGTYPKFDSILGIVSPKTGTTSAFYGSLTNFTLVDDAGGSTLYFHCRLFTIPYVRAGDSVKVLLIHTANPAEANFWSAGAYLECP